MYIYIYMYIIFIYLTYIMYMDILPTIYNPPYDNTMCRTCSNCER